MGYTFTPIAVDLSRVTAAVGSKDRNLLNSLVRKFSEEFEEIDAIAGDLDDDADSGDVEEFADGPEGLEQLARSFREGLAPLMQAVAEMAPNPPGAPTQPRPLAEAIDAVSQQFAARDADPDEDDDDEFGPEAAELPEEVNTPEKLRSAAFDAVLRIFRGEDLPPEHPLARAMADDPEPDDTDDADDPDDAGGPRTLMADVMRQFIMGEPYDPRVGFKYGYALEKLCLHFGEFLPNEHWSSFRSGASAGSFRKLDRTLKSLGVPDKTFRVQTHLENRGSPIPIPEIDDFPGIGYVRRDEIREAAAALDRADLAAIQDEDLRASLGEVQEWFRTCVESQSDLVCFYY